MLKVLKIELSNLFPRPLENAKIEIFVYPKNVYKLENNRRIYLPSLIARLSTNNYGNAEVQLVANDKLFPQPNIYVAKVMYNFSTYYFPFRILSTMDDIVYLHDVISDFENTDCEVEQRPGYYVVGKNIYVV